jgi:type VI secretion system secreted protein VgrG
MPVAWTGGSATPNWLNPITLVGQSSVFVNISAVIPPPLLTPAIYGFSGVTNTSNPSPPFFGSVVNGEVDTPLTPTSITGLCTVTGCPGLVNGSIFTSGAAQVTAATVQALSLHTAATALAPACFATGVFTIPGGPGHNLSGKDLGTIGPLPAGVYCFSTTAGLTGTLTLSGGPTASYTFLIGSALTTASNSNVLLTNGTLHQNVFWDVGSGVTFGTGTSFQGVIDSSAAITDAGGSSLTGNAWSRDAAVTLIGTTITP